jgi:hypothetical protein
VTSAKRGKGRIHQETEGKTPEQQHQAMTWAQRLQDEIVVPARQQGYSEIWLAGFIDLSTVGLRPVQTSLHSIRIPQRPLR